MSYAKLSADLLRGRLCRLFITEGTRTHGKCIARCLRLQIRIRRGRVTFDIKRVIKKRKCASCMFRKMCFERASHEKHSSAAEVLALVNSGTRCSTLAGSTFFLHHGSL